MSELYRPISVLSDRIEQRYAMGNPVELWLKGHRPDFEVDRINPLEIFKYTSGSPSLIGRFPMRAMALVEEDVVSIFQGRGYYVDRTFGIRNTVTGLNGLFQRAGLPYTIERF